MWVLGLKGLTHIFLHANFFLFHRRLQFSFHSPDINEMLNLCYSKPPVLGHPRMVFS